MSPGGGPTPPSDGKWIFPLPSWRGYRPTVSDQYQAIETSSHRRHPGLDLMYRRQAGGADQMWPSGRVGEKANGSKLFFMPDSIYARAARDGTVWQTVKTDRGIGIVLDHGAPFATFYQHLSATVFPLGVSKGAGAIRVKAGQPIGIVGFSSIDAQRLMHLHFEVWYKGGSGFHVDPWPLIERAPLPPEKWS